jgi:hypothetical protein
MSVMRVALSQAKLDVIPVDFRADPDGEWEYEALARGVGFDERWGQMAVGALTQPFGGFPEGAAVVTFTSGSRCSVALVDCTTRQSASVSESRSESSRAA